MFFYIPGEINKSLTVKTMYVVDPFVYNPGDWTACIDFSKTPLLINRDGSTCVVYVKTIDVKGKKRKVLLTDQGTVYKLKKIQTRG